MDYQDMQNAHPQQTEAVGDWVEVFGGLADLDVAAAVTVRKHIMEERGPTNPHGACGCWRCQPGIGGVAQSDKPVLDRLFALHLNRMDETTQAEFLGSWVLNPRHRGEAYQQVLTWLQIVKGERVAEPRYREVR